MLATKYFVKWAGGAYSTAPMLQTPELYIRGLLLRGKRGRIAEGEGKVKGKEGRGRWGGIGPTQKFWRGAPMA